MSQIKPKFAPLLVPYTAVGAANGVAALDANSKLAASALPTGVAAFTRNKETITLSATDITNGYVTLAQKVLVNSVHAMIRGLGMIEESLDGGTSGDYVVDNTGPKTKITFRNDLITAAPMGTPLAAGDVVHVGYAY